MKLYLSSYQYGNCFDTYLEMVGAKGRVAVIDNSRDGFDESRKLQRTSDTVSHLGSLGLEVETVDLREYFGGEDDASKKLESFDGVWLLGGNAFVLRKAFRQSGLDEHLPTLLKNGLVYGGFSAAGCILAPSLHGIELVDDEHLRTPVYQEETIWEGLGILDYAFVPHYKSDHPESADIDNYVAYLEAHNLPYKALRDGEVIVVDNYHQ